MAMVIAPEVTAKCVLTCTITTVDDDVYAFLPLTHKHILYVY